MNKIEIAKHLINLGNGDVEPNNGIGGICHDIWMTFDFIQRLTEAEQLVKSYAQGWLKHSGDPLFPVPRKDLPANGALWKPWANTQYGNDRRELCLFIAQKIFEEECELVEVHGQKQFQLSGEPIAWLLAGVNDTTKLKLAGE